jgi:hypothetical protein
MSRAIKDWSDKKIGKLTFKNRLEEKVSGAFLWRCVCDCGNCGNCVDIVPAEVARGRVVSCDFCNENSENPKRRVRNHFISSARVVWRQYYKDGDVSFEYFLKITQEDCFYCGRKPSNSYTKKMKTKSKNGSGEFIYNGLDRIDSFLPHNKNNVVPSCFQCNFSKLNYKQDDFFNWVEKVYKFFVLPNQKKPFDDEVSGNDF